MYMTSHAANDSRSKSAGRHNFTTGVSSIKINTHFYQCTTTFLTMWSESLYAFPKCSDINYAEQFSPQQDAWVLIFPADCISEHKREIIYVYVTWSGCGHTFICSFLLLYLSVMSLSRTMSPLLPQGLPNLACQVSAPAVFVSGYTGKEEKEKHT